MLVTAFEEVAAVDKREANRARSARELFEQIKGELDRARAAQFRSGGAEDCLRGGLPETERSHD